MPTTIGRWLSLASIPAGVLLVLAWLIPVSFLLPYMSAPDVRAVAGPAGNLALLNHWLTLGLAVLICVAFPAIAQAARGGWAAAIGATLCTLAPAAGGGTLRHRRRVVRRRGLPGRSAAPRRSRAVCVHPADGLVWCCGTLRDDAAVRYRLRARVKHVPEDVRVPGDVGSGHRMGVVRLRGVAPPRSGDRVV